MTDKYDEAWQDWIKGEAITDNQLKLLADELKTSLRVLRFLEHGETSLTSTMIRGKLYTVEELIRLRST